MKILDVKNSIPYPLNTGTNIASYCLLKALALNHEVSFFGLAKSESEIEAASSLKTFCKDVILTLAPNKRSTFHKLYYRLLFLMNLLAKGKPFEESYSSAGPWKNAFSAHLRKERYDLVIAEYWHNAWVFELLPRGIAGALLIHDAAFVNDERLLAVSRNPLRRLRIRFFSRLKKRREKRAIERAPHILALSGEDIGHIRQRLSSLEGKIAAPIPILLPARKQQPPARARGETRDLYFVGSTRRINNLDAIRYFASAIFPRIRSQVAGTTFFVIGRGEERTRQGLESVEGLKVLWRDADISELVPPGSVCVVPLRIGSGIKYKILDAFAMGNPVVTSGVGAEGISFYRNFPQLVQDEPEAFADEVIRLLRDDTWYGELRKSQFDYVSQECSIERGSRSLTRLVERIAGSQPDTKTSEDVMKAFVE